MIDPRLLRDDPEVIRGSLARRGSKIDLEALIEMDSSLRSVRRQAEDLRAAQKDAGREIATLQGEAKEKAIAEVADLAARVKEAGAEVDRLQADFELAWLEVPNLVATDAADGFSE
ncbi:MAG: serine--tRNA ligase, partial [Acidimicrobiia bacterium]